MNLLNNFLNIAGYQFVTLTNLPLLRQDFLSMCTLLQIKGTILLSHEGININLAGEKDNIEQFIGQLSNINKNIFTSMRFHRSYSATLPFKRLKVKLKKEIITLRQANANPTKEVQAPRVSPQQLKTWLDTGRNIKLIDTRNEYELAYGRFEQAVSLSLDHFCELPDKLNNLNNLDNGLDAGLAPEMPEIVLYCTGGIRCEKAALYLQSQGFSNVYQLDGGILGYFAEVGSDHYQGGCYVFDERVSVQPEEYTK